MIFTGGMSMNSTVDQFNWQADIRYIIERALPNDDYQIVCFHQSKSSESLYVDILWENYLFQLRFSFHDHDDHNRDLYSFNLTSYPQDQPLISKIHQIISKRRCGTILTYHHFVTLSLVEKTGQFQDQALIRRDDLFWDQGKPLINGPLEECLNFLWTHQLILIKHATQQIFLSDSGEHLLGHYWDVADQYLEDLAWDNNPRTNSPEELRNLLND